MERVLVAVIVCAVLGACAPSGPNAAQATASESGLGASLGGVGRAIQQEGESMKFEVGKDDAEGGYHNGTGTGTGTGTGNF